MAYRGSLKQCISLLPDRYRMYPDRLWAIVLVVRAKYYTVLDDSDLDKRGSQPGQSEDRIIFRGTAREFAAFAHNQQLSLFSEEIDNASQKDIQIGEQ